MSTASAPASPLVVRSPDLPPVGELPGFAPAPAPLLPPAALPAPPPAVPTAGEVGNMQIARKYVCFTFTDGLLTFTDGFRPHSSRHPSRRLALRARSPRPAARPQPQHHSAREPRGISWPDRWCACRFRVQPLRSRVWYVEGVCRGRR